MSNSLTVELVLKGGHIDPDLSLEACRVALLKRIADQETESTQIAQAVSDLFDRRQGKAIAMPVLGSMVAQALGAEPEQFKVLSERALNYVRANSQERKAADGTVTKHPDSLFVIGKGKNGGAYRRADRVEKGAEGQATGQATEETDEAVSE